MPMRSVLLSAATAVLLMSPTPSAAQSSPSAHTTGFRYDGGRRLVGEIKPDPDGAGALNFLAVRYSFDSYGNRIRVEEGELTSWQPEAVAPSAWSGFTVFRTVDATFDTLGRKIKETVVAGGAVQGVTQYSYDARDRVVCAAVRMNPATYSSLPASACSPATAGAHGQDRITRTTYYANPRALVAKVQRAYATDLQQDYASYEYDANENRTTVIDANGNKATMVWDGHDRQTHWYFPSKTTKGAIDSTDYEQYSYDQNGNRTAVRKRDGTGISISYDALNRVTIKAAPASASGAAGYSIHYGYDLRGLQTHSRFGSSTGPGIASTYDGFGRLVSSKSDMGGTAHTLTHEYDLNSARTAVTYPDGARFNYGYDGVGRMTSVAEPYLSGAGNGHLIARYWYNNAGLRSSVVRGADSYGFATIHYYDGARRLTSMHNDLPGTENDMAFSFTYNPASQIASRTRDRDSYAWTEAYAVNRSYGVNGLNQYTGAGPATFCYDANGNLTSDGTTAYRYDAENRLTEVRAAVSTACPVSYTGALKASLKYDPLGRLWETSGGSAGATRFLYDRDALVAEYDQNGTMLRRYVHGAGVDAPVALYEGSGTGFGNRGYHQPDERGSIVALINADGTMRKINSYDDWGIPAAGNLGRFQYTGQAWIPEIRMYHYKARVYSPTLGRFLQTDPVGYDDQINLYAYVANDPVNGTDPDGQEGVFEWVLESAKMVGNDLADLGGAIAEGDFEYAFGGMPPTMGGGIVSTTATAARATTTTAARAAVAGREAAVSRAAAKELRAAASVTPRITREGLPGIRVAKKDGSVTDITPTRVKEFKPNSHPNAPAGTMQRVRFPNAIPGSKGYKRPPTPVEQRMINTKSNPGIVCRYTGWFCK